MQAAAGTTLKAVEFLGSSSSPRLASSNQHAFMLGPGTDWLQQEGRATLPKSLALRGTLFGKQKCLGWGLLSPVICCEKVCVSDHLAKPKRKKCKRKATFLFCTTSSTFLSQHTTASSFRWSLRSSAAHNSALCVRTRAPCGLFTAQYQHFQYLCTSHRSAEQRSQRPPARSQY